MNVLAISRLIYKGDNMEPILLFDGNEAKRIAKCTSKEKHRYNIRCMHFKKNDSGGVDLYATNGFVLYKRSNIIEPEVAASLEDKFAVDSVNFERLQATDMVYLTGDGNDFWFNIVSAKGGCVRVDRDKEALAPDFENVIPKEKQDDTISLDASLLLTIAEAMHPNKWGRGVVRIRKSTTDGAAAYFLEVNSENIMGLIMPVDTSKW